MSEDLKQTRELLQKLCEDPDYPADLITDRIIHEIKTIEEYLRVSTFGDHCNNYNHGFEEVLKLRDLAFKVAKLIKSEMNFPDKKDDLNFKDELQKAFERRKAAQDEILQHFINLQKHKYDEEKKNETNIKNLEN